MNFVRRNFFNLLTDTYASLNLYRTNEQIKLNWAIKRCHVTVQYLRTYTVLFIRFLNSILSCWPTLQLINVRRNKEKKRHWEKGVGEEGRGLRIQLYLVFSYKQCNHLIKCDELGYDIWIKERPWIALGIHSIGVQGGTVHCAVDVHRMTE